MFNNLCIFKTITYNNDNKQVTSTETVNVYKRMTITFITHVIHVIEKRKTIEV